MTFRWRLALGVLVLTPSLAAAQGNGQLRGFARDDTGRSLPGVTVDVHSTAGGTESSLTTDSDGAFAAELPPGRYQLAFRLPSFATTLRTVELAAGATASVDITLRLALNADVLVTAKRTFRTLTDLDEPVNGLIDYYYASRLPGEPLAGIDDVHTHPLQPFRVRLSFTALF